MPKLQVDNECGLVTTVPNGERLFIQVAIPIKYSSPVAHESRQVWQLDCGLTSMECTGIQFTLDRIDRGLPLTARDLISIQAKVVSATGNVFTIGFGVYTTFTVDLSDGSVRYAESWEPSGAEKIEARGETKCSVRRVSL
jgi:hypothetical protein